MTEQAPTLQVLSTEQRLDRYIQVVHQKTQLELEIALAKENVKELNAQIHALDEELIEMTRLYTSGQQVLGVV